MVQNPIENNAHYGYQTQLLIDFFNSGELDQVQTITVEPRYGYLATIDYVTGTRRILHGHDMGFNAGSSERLAQDKGYTKFVLRSLGINCPTGEEFLLPWWADTLRNSERQQQNKNILDTRDADTYITSTLDYPVYVKPVDGSQGSGVRKIYNSSELNDTFATYNDERIKVALVEEAVTMPDYRLLIFDGELINAYERRPLSVVGDGQKNIGDLVGSLAETFKIQGRDLHLEKQLPDIQTYLGRLGMSLAFTPRNNEHIRLSDISNLSAGGTPYEVSEDIHPQWGDLAARIAKGFNLRICGVDLACQNIRSKESEYSVLEVNSSPGARQFMASSAAGQQKVKDTLRRLFNTPA